MPVSSAAVRSLFETESLGAPERAVGFLLWRITATYQREMDRALTALDLTNLQFISLALVGWFQRSGHTGTQADLARTSGIHPMQLSLMLKTLEAKRLVQRTRSETDNRAKRVALTPQGLQRLREALPVAIRVQAELFGEDGRQGGALHTMLAPVDARLLSRPS